VKSMSQAVLRSSVSKGRPVSSGASLCQGIKARGEVLEHCFSHRRATDVAQADKQHGYPMVFIISHRLVKS
jgi:hypothetical protein